LGAGDAILFRGKVVAAKLKEVLILSLVHPIRQERPSCAKSAI
jgi:hypothetical protein